MTAFVMRDGIVPAYTCDCGAELRIVFPVTALNWLAQAAAFRASHVACARSSSASAPETVPAYDVADRALCYPSRGSIWPRHDWGLSGCKRCGASLPKAVIRTIAPETHKNARQGHF